MNQNLYKLGIDIGSTTVKIAILDENDDLVFSDYERHFANIQDTLAALLEKAYRKEGDMNLAPMITGSGGLTLAKHLGIPFVQEVISVSTALQHYAPQTDVAIELGGEDAKIIYFEGGNVEQRMNGICAGGTGSFIDQMASLIQTDAPGLNEYAKKNEKYGFENKEVSKRISALPGVANDAGGVIKFIPLSEEELGKANYKELVETRHSIRHFSDKPVELERVEDAVKLAQYTPSACNRQGWKTYIVKDKAVLREVLKNQNGNRGFGQEFDKLLVVVGDLRYFNRDREVFQVYIDGGMYAMRVLDSLYYERIASVPLSASLTKEQEENVRKLLKLDPAEVLIMFIGIGNYPDECQTTRSERKPAEYTVI